MPRSVQYVLSVLILLAAAAGLVFLLCYRRPPEGPTGNQLVVLSPHPDSVQDEFFGAFCDWHKRQTGESCQVVRKDIGEGTQGQRTYIVEMFSKNPDGIGVDIFWGGGVDPYIELKKKRLLQAYRLPDDLLQAIPPRCAGQPVYDPEFEWYGAALSGFGIIYNKKYQKEAKLPAPETWEDLARPEMLGDIAIVDPRKSGVAHTLCEIMLQAYGWEKGFEVMTQMAGNCKRTYNSASDVPNNVALGEIIFGPTIDFYAWAQIVQNGPETIGFVMPKGLTVINPDAMGILKGAPNLELAKAFLRFTLSEDGQRLWLLPVGALGGPKRKAIGRISIMPTLHEKYAKECLVPIDPEVFKSGMDYDFGKAAARQAILNDLLGALLIDTNDDLSAGWRALVAAKSASGDRLKDFTAPPISEEEMMALAKDRWKDDAFRNSKIAEWVKFARAKYKKVQTR